MRKPKPIRPQLVTDRTGTTYTLTPLEGFATPVVIQSDLFGSAEPLPPVAPATPNNSLFGGME